MGGVAEMPLTRLWKVGQGGASSSLFPGNKFLNSQVLGVSVQPFLPNNRIP